MKLQLLACTDTLPARNDIPIVARISLPSGTVRLDFIGQRRILGYSFRVMNGTWLKKNLHRANRRAPVVLALFLFVASGIAAEDVPDPLWRKAVAVASTNADWVAGLVITRSEVLHKGRSEAVHEMWERSKLGETGELITQTVKILEDGKDVTAQQKAGRKDTGEISTTGSQGRGNPFDPRVQEEVTAQPTGQTKIVEGRNCVAYKFERKGKKPPVVRGLVWLDQETGSPVTIENMTIEPLPNKHLKRLAVATRYESTPDGAWYPKEIITTGMVSMFFIKADILSTTTFSNYWRRPHPSAGKNEK